MSTAAERLTEIVGEYDRLRAPDEASEMMQDLRELLAENEHMRRLLQSKYDQEQNLRAIDNHAWTLGCEDALGIRF